MTSALSLASSPFENFSSAAVVDGRPKKPRGPTLLRVLCDIEICIGVHLQACRNVRIDKVALAAAVKRDTHLATAPSPFQAGHSCPNYSRRYNRPTMALTSGKKLEPFWRRERALLGRAGSARRNPERGEGSL